MVPANGWSVARAAPEARTGGNSRWRGAVNFSVCAFRRSASPHFIWRRNNSGFRSCRKTRVQSHRENESVHPPPRSGGGGPLELAQRANRGGGGACSAASLSLKEKECR